MRKLNYQDYEGDMAKAQLKKIESYAAKLNDMIHPEDELEAWVQAKLSVVAAYMGDIKHYLDYELENAGETTDKWEVEGYKRGGTTDTDSMYRVKPSSEVEDMLEARAYVGEKIWKTYSRQEKKDAVGYLKAQGRIGHYGMEESIEDISGMQYEFADGGKLIGKQANLDMNKNGKLDKEDFQILRGKKMAEGGEIGKNVFKDTFFETEEDAKRFIKAGKPSLRKQLREGNWVLVYNGKEYFIAERNKMADGGTTVVDVIDSSRGREYEEYEMVVISKEANKDGGRIFKDRFLVSAKDIKQAKEIATEMWQKEWGNSDLSFMQVMSDSLYRLKYMDKFADGGKIESAAKRKADNPNWTNEKLLAEYNSLKIDLEDLKEGKITPRKVIGGGYKSSAVAKRIAKEWLENRIAEYKMALEIRGVMADGGMMADGGQMMKEGGEVYRLGDTWSSIFDYDGMLRMALKAKTSWGVKKLEKLSDSLTDVNYHTVNRPLGEAIEALEKDMPNVADIKMEEFHEAVKKEMAKN